jgi:DNA mismatch repair protein MutS2
MNSHSIRVLEFDQIVDKLHDLCWSVPAKRFAIAPSNDLAQIEHSLDCLAEMMEIYRTDNGPPGLIFEDIDLMLERCAAQGAVLEPSELTKVADLYNAAKGFIDLDQRYANLNRLCSDLEYAEDMVSDIDRMIEPPNEIKDNATPRLKEIRRRIRRTRQLLETKFNSYLESDYARFLSDNVVTIREGRFVLPVREGDRGKIKGVVHDRSSTGATFFIEPFETVEYNNSYRELLAEEKQEIYRILRELTDKALSRLDSIKQNIRILIELDIYSAKARLALYLDCSRPEINDKNYINLKSCYHPLLKWRDVQAGKNTTVPMDLELGKAFSTLIITGPNTGGKTVALKTVGLACLMAQTGLFLPAADGSSLPVFDNIFADIGDEQSLEASLSTFSAHLENIKSALKEATAKCLVLLDEIGAGTDPDEGAALGQAIIENLTTRGIPSIVTTHHGKLKTLAVNIKGVENASLDFDTENMKPAFRFRTGVPGLSFAIETARKLGLNESITDRAESLIDRSERRLGEIVTELTGKLRSAEEDLQKAEEKRLSYEALSRLYSDKLENIEQEKKKIKKEALESAEKLIRQVKSELNELIEQAKKSDKKIEALRAAKRETESRIETTREQLKQFETPVQRIAASGKVGERVYLPEMDAAGEIIEAPDTAGKVKVKIGNVVLHTQINKLFKTSEPEKPAGQTTHGSAFADITPSMEIDLRGLTFEEAQPALDKYLEDVYLANLNNVSIIHGKGTGALRMKVHEYLKTHHRVKSFRLGYWDEGSYGVTIVEMKRE